MDRLLPRTCVALGGAFRLGSPFAELQPIRRKGIAPGKGQNPFLRHGIAKLSLRDSGAVYAKGVGKEK